jgi:3-phenylpropionate/trans-cinnamate dioxygenase ferredoxin component
MTDHVDPLSNKNHELPVTNHESRITVLPMSSWISVCRAVDLPAGAHRIVDLDGAQAAVFNLDGEFYAIEDVCTHDGGILTGGPVEGACIVCPRHGARFSIKTGEALSAPAFEPTAKFPVRVVDGEVQVRDDRWDS